VVGGQIVVRLPEAGTTARSSDAGWYMSMVVRRAFMILWVRILPSRRVARKAA
jgi:hypothetical protein